MTHEPARAADERVRVPVEVEVARGEPEVGLDALARVLEETVPVVHEEPGSARSSLRDQGRRQIEVHEGPRFLPMRGLV